MQRMIAVAVVLLLAGCFGVEPAAEEPAEAARLAASEPLVLADLTSDGCRYNDVIFLVPLAEAQARLPDGFVARSPVGAAPDLGALVINFMHCTGGFAWSAADLFVVVQPPDVRDEVFGFDAENRTHPAADLELNLYLLAFHTDHEGMQGVLERAGVAHAPGRVAKTSVVEGFAQGSLRDDEGALVDYVVTGAEVGAFKVQHRQWHQSDAGLLLIERFFTKDGGPVPVTQGPATCLLRPGSPFAQLVGDTPCSLGQDVDEEWEWAGRAYLFPGVVP